MDRRLWSVHMQRPVGRYLRRLDRVLLPILRRLAWERMWYFVECGHDLMRSRRDQTIPASTNRLKAGLAVFSPSFVYLAAHGMA